MTSTFRTITAAAGVAALTLVLAACGSDDEKDGSSDDKALSSAEFKTQANALCKTANSEIATLEQGLGAATTEAEATEVVNQLVDRIDELVDDIDDLEAPESLDDGVEGMLDSVTKVVDQIKSQGLAFFANQTADPFADADAKSVALGLDDCAGND